MDFELFKGRNEPTAHCRFMLRSYNDLSLSAVVIKLS